MKKLTAEGIFVLLKSLVNTLGVEVNPLTEFPTGLELPQTILSLVCSQGTR